MSAAVFDPPQLDRPGPAPRSPFTADERLRRAADPFGGFSVAEVQERLGPVPAWRVRSWPPPGTATFADAVACADRGELCELIDGILLEKTVGHWESVLGMRVGSKLRSSAEIRNSGIVVGADGQVELPEGQTRLPDAAFTGWGRMPGGYDPTVAVPDLPPTIACEVISRSNTREEMGRKLCEYFEAGVELVWYVRPRTRTVDIHTAAEEFTMLSADAGDVLTAGDVLPGFEYPLADLFAPPTPPADGEDRSPASGVEERPDAG